MVLFLFNAVQNILGFLLGASLGFLVTCWVMRSQTYQFYFWFITDKTFLARLGLCLCFWPATMAWSIHQIRSHGRPRRLSRRFAGFWALAGLFFLGAMTTFPLPVGKMALDVLSILCIWLSVLFLPQRQVRPRSINSHMKRTEKAG